MRVVFCIWRIWSAHFLQSILVHTIIDDENGVLGVAMRTREGGTRSALLHF